MIEYGVPLLFLFVVLVVAPVGLVVALFFSVRAAARWWLRSVARFAVAERARAARELMVHERGQGWQTVER